MGKLIKKEKNEKCEENFKGFNETMESMNIYIMGVPEEQERGKEPESLLKAIKIKIPGNSSSLETEMDTQIKELKGFQKKKKRRNQRSPQMTHYD